MIDGLFVTDEDLLQRINAAEIDLMAVQSLIIGCGVLENSYAFKLMGKHHYFHVKKMDFEKYEREGSLHLRELYALKAMRGL
jgi:hypothetical protein